MTVRQSTHYRTVQFGVETLDAGIVLPRHRHAAGYATVVLAGSFEEASFAGRFVAVPGDVLLHGAFDCHANRAMTHRALQILRLPWTDNLLEGRFRVRDPDALAILAERDAGEAMAQLRNDLIRVPSADLHWTERLAQALRTDPAVRLEAWAESENLAPETVSRGFHHAFGVAPKVFRLESRARRAWKSILLTSAPLTVLDPRAGLFGSSSPYSVRRGADGSRAQLLAAQRRGDLARQVRSS